ncbi:Fe(3+) ABC transporter substrate-binding protein [Roseibium aggregatum]|uniref:Fe(3+) ABC transporter substrate-binding protein n=1 Tax=Roseibium aggregatum TaxID=187304 RepID=A0A926NYX9_9HYPH|nr:Fe(3+) ABC transporter substrate-binding protein [Roseibium aggregatum]MBD1546185.1 Fe(3+) ABC transporter substrate-binding protein [Roseibium aggregatum]
MNKTLCAISGAVALASTFFSAAPALADGEVNIYSYRQPFLIQPLLDAFTEKTGIKTNVVFSSKGLGQRIAAEGENSPADVMMTVDIGRLDGARDLGIAAPIESTVVSTNIPAEFRDPDGMWVGLTSRARVIYASKDRVDQTAITYEELADPKWKGRICTRSGQHDYTIGLIASMIAHHGEADTEKWLEAVRDNLARKPAGNDRAQVKSIYAGECDIALGNTYYMGKMETNDKEPEQKEWAASVRILFPNSEDRGSHVNLSGVVLMKHAPNKDNALKLIEFLTSHDAQEIYAETNFEYPVTPGVAVSDRVKAWGTLKPDSMPLSDVAKYRKAASEMVDRVRFDDGPAT